jgi:hypothetical protein
LGLSRPADPADDECRLDITREDSLVPAGQINPQGRCLLASIVNNPTTAGKIGPTQTPAPPALYYYLLDHPVVIGALTQKLEMGTYQFTPKGPAQYWGDDGEGTQGMLTRVYDDATTRIFHIDGHHKGQVFPMVRARAVIFIKIAHVPGQNGAPIVETSLNVYTRLNDPVLSAIVFVLRPLIGEAVARKLTRGFEITNQLAAMMAQDPDRILHELPALTTLDPDDQRALTAILNGLPKNSAPPPLKPAS